MRKPTKMGYCTCCTDQIMVFDTDGRPAAVNDNYREARVELSDGSQGRLSFCSDCLEKGVDAEEAILNAIDGLRSDLGAKAWGEEFKNWYMERYDQMRIKSVRDVVKTHPVIGFVPLTATEAEKIQPFKNLDEGAYRVPQWHPAPDRFPQKVGAEGASDVSPV